MTTDSACKWNEVALATGAALLCFHLIGGGTPAAAGIVSINQHRVPVAGCSASTPLPFDIINSVGVHSFHVGPDDSQYNCALGGYKNRSRPSVFSDDFGGYDLDTDRDKWFTRIQGICTYANSSSGANRGRRHYEHYQPDLENRLNWGLQIRSVNDFPGSQSDPYSAYGFLNRLDDAGYANGCAGMGDGGTLSRLTQNGTIGIGVTSSGNRVQWNGQKATLIGYGAMGAAAAAGGGRLSSDSYFRVLRHFFANFTRVWLVEQWTSLAVCASPQLDLPTAFSGSMASDYDLAILNPLYWNRFRAFVQEAADRGIAVQVSLFDRYSVINHDLTDPDCHGKFGDSPYRSVNNVPQQQYLADISCAAQCNPSCQSSFDAAVPTDSPDDSCTTCDQHAHPGFTNPEWIDGGGQPDAGVPAAIHEAFIDRAVQEVGGIGNVIFEIINEGRKDCDWNDSPDSDGIGDRNETWQDSTAKRVRSKLPIWVGRDAFNKAENALAGQPTDISGQVWQTDQTHNAQVWNHVDCEYSGSCTPQQIKTCTGGSGCNMILTNPYVSLGAASAVAAPTSSDMLGTIAVPAQPWTTNFSVRADLVRTQGNIAIGLKTASDDQVIVELRPPAGSGTHRIVLVQVQAGKATDLSSTDITDSDIPSLANVRLEVVNPLLQLGTASVFFDGAPVVGMSGIGLSFYSIPNRAFFRGTKDSNPYLSSYGSVDSFEVDAVCGSEAFCPAIALQDGFETGNFDGWTTATVSGSNTMAVTTGAHLTGTYGAQVNVSPSGTNTVYAEFDNLSAGDTTAKFGWSMNFQTLNAPDPGALGSRLFRFLSVLDSTQSRTFLIFFARRLSTSPGDWQLVASAWDTSLNQYVVVGSLDLFPYHSATTRQIECTWSAGAPGGLSCTNLGNSQSFTVTTSQQGLHLDMFRLGFFDYDSFGQNAGGAAYFDDVTVYSPYVQEGYIPPP